MKYARNRGMRTNIFRKFLFEILYVPRKFKNEYPEMEKLFKVSPDPWNFKNSKYESKRFDLMERFVHKVKHDKILEIGCAEGDFTKILSKLSKNVLAVDISKTAVGRAEKICPGVQFLITDFTEAGFCSGRKFDLTIASEVFYYVSEGKLFMFLRRINTKYLLMTNAWTVFRCIEKIIERCGYRKIEDKFLFRLEYLNLKGTHISLWRKL